MLFVVSDIHSCYEPMIMVLKEKNFFESRKNKLVVIGDALDRGPDARKVIDFLLSLHKEGRLIYIKGNHEDLFLECIQEIENGGILQIVCGMSHHYTNGTFSTLLQISNMSERDAVNSPCELLERVKASDYYNILLPSCLNFYENEKYVFVHGFLPVIRNIKDNVVLYRYNPNWRNAENSVWRDAVWLNGIDMVCKNYITVPNKIVVVGHIHSSYGHRLYGDKNIVDKYSVFLDKGIMAIDACTVKSGKVNCLLLE